MYIGTNLTCARIDLAILNFLDMYLLQLFKDELLHNHLSSKILKNSEKDRLLLKLKNRINQDGYLLLQNSKSRSQLTNKELVVIEFYHLINKALHIQKKRKSTNPTNASIKKRLDSKKRQAEKKKNRRSSY